MNIKQDIIPGLDQPALNAVKIVVAHESGNPNNTGPDSLENEINYMKNNWSRGAKAYTSHWVGGGGRIVQLAETGKRQNGAGWPANGIAYAHVELARTDSKETFKKDYKAYVGLLRHLAKEANLPVTFDSNDDKGIKSHDWVRKNLGGTTHTDPFAYLASHGVGKSQFAHDVENGIGGEVEVSEPSTNKSILQMANEVIKGLHGNGHANRRVSLGVNQSVYNKIKSEVNRKLGAPADKAPQKSISEMADEVIAGKHGSGHENRRQSLGISQSKYEKVRAEVNRRASGNSKSVDEMAKEVSQGLHGNGHANRRKSLGVSKATYEKVRAKVNGGSVSSGGGKSVKQMADEIINGKGIPNGHEARRKHFGISKAKYEKVRKEVNRRLS